MMFTAASFFISSVLAIMLLVCLIYAKKYKWSFMWINVYVLLILCCCFFIIAVATLILQSRKGTIISSDEEVDNRVNESMITYNFNV